MNTNRPADWYTDTDYNGQTFRVPVTGTNENLNAKHDVIPDDDHAMAFLMQDGNLAVPGGRYGDDTADCAPIAMAISRIFQDSNGDPISYNDLDHAMGLVVNSHDDVAYMIREYGPTIGIDPDDFRGMDDDEDDDESEDE